MIDWFTLTAQLVNFLILILLLKRFLYQPILQALDAREAKIKAGLQEAEDKRQQAQAEYEEFLRKNQEVDEQRKQFLKLAQEEAKIEHQRLFDKARQEMEEWRVKQQEVLKNEQENLITAITQRTQSEIFTIAEQALHELAEVSLEQQIIAVFIQKLQQLGENEKQQILATLKNTATPLLIRTTFPLQTTQIIELEQVVQKIFGADTQIQVKTVPELICGIELSSDGQKISWTIATYLQNLEEQLHQVLQQHD